MHNRNCTYVPSQSLTSTNKKRPLADADTNRMDTDDSCEKKLKKDPMENSESITNEEQKLAKYDANHPLPDGQGPTCFITLYTNLNDLKMNEVCEFVCILDPNLQEKDEDGHPTRLHCLYFNRLPSLNLHVIAKTPLHQKTATELTNVRNEFMQVFFLSFSEGEVTCAFDE